MAADVFGKLLRRRIAPLRILAQRHRNNVIQVPAQSLAEAGVGLTGRSLLLAGGLLGVSARRFLPYGCARFRRIGFADGSHDFSTTVEFIRTASRQQTEQDYSERIHIAGSRDRVAAYLFRAREFRG